LVEWKLAFLGEGEPGATLPFLIQDRTSREWRVYPSASMSGAELTGMVAVILSGQDLAASIDLFRRVYSWSSPQIEIDANRSARLAHFPNTPVLLAAALNEAGWLAERLAQFGESPCAFLIGMSNWQTTIRNHALSKPLT
jgi:hypothetical protein